MKSFAEINSILSSNKDYLSKKYKIKHLAIFGSYSRSEETKNSDTDIMVEFEKPIGIEFIDLANELQEILNIKVDLISKNGIKP
ncbi:MAG: nucleotidyltransferase family protein [Bacteroidota bacterium]